MSIIDAAKATRIYSIQYTDRRGLGWYVKFKGRWSAEEQTFYVAGPFDTATLAQSTCDLLNLAATLEELMKANEDVLRVVGDGSVWAAMVTLSSEVDRIMKQAWVGEEQAI